MLAFGKDCESRVLSFIIYQRQRKNRVKIEEQEDYLRYFCCHLYLDILTLHNVLEIVLLILQLTNPCVKLLNQCFQLLCRNTHSCSKMINISELYFYSYTFILENYKTTFLLIIILQIVKCSVRIIIQID